MRRFKYIYGPVYSWRLGRSLGIDLLCGKNKICTFDCIYCQIGNTNVYDIKRRTFVPTKYIIEEIEKLPNIKIDYITFSGKGEPTLAKNLGQAIKEVKRIRKEPIAVLTNSSLISEKDVRNELTLADLVACKMDASSADTFTLVNEPARGLRFESIIQGIKRFRKVYKKKLALQLMFTEYNKKDAPKIAALAEGLHPDEIHINTPLRPSKIRPLSKADILDIKRYFRRFNVITIYDKPRKSTKPINRMDTKMRRGSAE